MSGETKADRMPLGGLIRRQVIRDVAHGGMSQTKLAEKYGVSQQAISQFCQRHAQEIEAVRAAADEEFAGILIAQKETRLAAYQDLYEAAVAERPVHDARTGRVMVGNDGLPIMESDGNLAAKVLKQAAEELGQLPNRLTLAGEVGVKTNYVIDGIDPGALK